MRPSRQKRLPRLSDWLLALILAALVVGGLVQAGRLVYHVTSASRAFRDLEDTLTAGQPSAILQDPGELSFQVAHLASLDHHVLATYRILRPLLPLCRYLGWVPYLGPDIAAIPSLLPTVSHATHAASTLTQTFSRLAPEAMELPRGLAHSVPRLVDVLSGSQSDLAHAQQSIDEAVEHRSRIDRANLTRRTKSLLDQFDRLLPSLSHGIQASRVLPGLLGAATPRTYLILAQNNHELRATGGFISGVGVIHIDQGQILGVHFQDSYTVDDLTQPHPLPPPALRREMGASILLLRDANWWPDFPTSAQVIMDLYLQDQGTQVDGVIAVDLVALTMLLRALEPVQIPGYPEAVSSTNLQSLIMRYWEAPRLAAPGQDVTDWWEHRKDYVGDLLAALFQRTTESSSLQDLVALSSSLADALTQKHLLIYVDQPVGAQSLLRELGWDGSLRNRAGDALMVVDSNVGFNKVNPNIEQALDLAVSIGADGTIQSDLVLSYRHRVTQPIPACVHESRYGDSYSDLMERCYWDYLRIYLLLNSQVSGLSGTDVPVQLSTENSRTVASTGFLLEPGQARQIRLSYVPAVNAVAGSYSLLVQKQPGTEAVPLRVTVELPAGSQPSHLAPSGFAGIAGKWVWQGTLAQDLDFQLSWD